MVSKRKAPPWHFREVQMELVLVAIKAGKHHLVSFARFFGTVVELSHSTSKLLTRRTLEELIIRLNDFLSIGYTPPPVVRQKRQ